MRPRRGNVLMMAVFIAVFLFFLSVALVMSNRQDILLSLSVDHRLRAQMAARAGSEIALSTARAKGYQEAHGKAGKMESGARYENTALEVELPHGKFVKLNGRGTSGFLNADRSILAQRLRFRSDNDPVLPLLFCKEVPPPPPDQTPPNLLVMGPTFKWSSLGPVPNKDGWLVAGDGPLCHMAGVAEAPPPIYDFQPGLIPTLEEVPWPEEAQSSKHTVYLTFAANEGVWKDIPDPASMETKSTPAMIDGDPRGTPNILTTEVNGELVQWSDSLFTGPQLEWYGLDGPAMAASEGLLYCHGTHYLYRGIRFQNRLVDGTVVPDQRDGQFYAEPCVLAYDLRQEEGGTWQPVVDLMTVQDPLSEPVIHPGPRPTTDSLAVCNSQVYAYNSEDHHQLLRGSKNGWSNYAITEGLSTGVAVYNNQVRPYKSSAYAEGGSRNILDGLDPNVDLSLRRAEIRGEMLRGGSFEPVALEQEMRVETGLLLTKNGTATRGKDFYTFANLRRELREPGARTLAEIAGLTKPMADTRNFQTLVHYDGEAWEIWPAGMMAYTGRIPTDVKVGIQPFTRDIDVDHLCVATYRGEEADLDRLVPVAVERQ